MVLLPVFVLTFQARTLTMAFPPTPAPKAIEMIAKASGRRLAVAPSLADEVILARLKEAPVDATLRHVAEALTAKWSTRSDGITWLVPDLQAVKSIQRDQDKQMDQHLRNALQQVRKKLSEQPEELDRQSMDAFLAWNDAIWKKEATEVGRPDRSEMMETERSPIWRALARICLQMDVKALVAMPDGDREVWAEQPTPMQHGFSDAAQEILRKYRQEFSLEYPTDEAKRVKLIVKKFEGGFIPVTLETTGETGKRLEMALVALHDDSEPPTNSDEVVAGEKPLVIPQEATEARMALSRQYRGKDRLAILAKWRSRLLDPVKFEPVQWHFGEDLLLAADARDKQMIGTVGDVTNSDFWEFVAVTPSQVLSRSTYDFVPSDDGWLVPRGPNDFDRASRAKAREFLRESVRMGGLSVDSAADWVGHAKHRTPFLGWVGDTLIVLHSITGPYSAMANALNDLVLGIWSSLGPGTREALRRGETVDIRQLSADARDQIAKQVYWYVGLAGDTMEATDRLPDGITSGTVRLNITETPVFIGWSSANGPTVSPMPMDASMFGRFLAEGNRSRRPVPAEIFQQYDRFKIGMHRSYELHFTLNPGAVPMTLHLSETLFPPEQEAVTELPPNLRSAIEKARQDAIAHPTKPPTPDAIHP